MSDDKKMVGDHHGGLRRSPVTATGDEFQQTSEGAFVSFWL
jgi:hypothetical protein